MSALEDVRATPGLEAYLDELEGRLATAVASHPGVVADVGSDALAAGGKRLRPLLVFLSAAEDEPPVAAGVAVELVHMATLVHDDLIDGARVRRGRAAAWTAHGADAARAAGDYLFARAFAELAAEGDPSRSACSPTPPSRSRAARRCSGASATTPTRRSRPTSSGAR